MWASSNSSFSTLKLLNPFAEPPMFTKLRSPRTSLASVARVFALLFLNDRLSFPALFVSKQLLVCRLLDNERVRVRIRRVL
jgi:hypothetical protein